MYYILLHVVSKFCQGIPLKVLPKLEGKCLAEKADTVSDGTVLGNT